MSGHPANPSQAHNEDKANLQMDMNGRPINQPILLHEEQAKQRAPSSKQRRGPTCLCTTWCGTERLRRTLSEAAAATAGSAMRARGAECSSARRRRGRLEEEEEERTRCISRGELKVWGGGTQKGELKKSADRLLSPILPFSPSPPPTTHFSSPHEAEEVHKAWPRGELKPCGSGVQVAGVVGHRSDGGACGGFVCGGAEGLDLRGLW